MHHLHILHGVGHAFGSGKSIRLIGLGIVAIGALIWAIVRAILNRKR